MMKVINHPQIKLFLGVAGLLVGLLVGYNASVPATTGESNRRRAEVSQPADLTGIYAGDDSGTYYVRQVGDMVWWLGHSQDGGVTYTNLFRGIRSGSQITGAWVDVPFGKYLGSGSMTLSISGSGSNVEIRKVNETGGFGPSLWKLGGRAPRAVTEPTAQFSILPDGRVQKTEADGSRRIYEDSGTVIIFPDGRQELIKNHEVQPATPPGGLLEQGGLKDWLRAQNNRVLGSIEGMLAPNERAASMANLRNKQSGKSEFDQLNLSTGALARMRR